MDYLEVAVYTTTEAGDAVSEVLMEAGAAGVSVEDAGDIARNQRPDNDWDYIDPDIFSELHGEVRVICYLPRDEALRGRLEQIKNRMEDLLALSGDDWDVGSGRVATRVVHTQDWENAWKKYYTSVKVGERIVIVPTWEHYQPESGEIVINLDPGMAFGTGTHETTGMCMRLLEKAVKKGDTMLDVGCGTGILSLCGVRLGADSAIAIDRDPVAVRVCKENVALNRLKKRIKVVQGDLLDKPYPPADLLTVNIVADAVIETARQVSAVMKESGQMICSGIIKDREEDVRAALYGAGLDVLERLETGEWVALRTAFK